MLKTLIELLGDDAPVLHRYLVKALVYGLLCGLTILSVLPVLGHLLAGDVPGATGWLGVLLVASLVCWALRRVVEKAGIRVGVAVLQGAGIASATTSRSCRWAGSTPTTPHA